MKRLRIVTIIASFIMAAPAAADTFNASALATVESAASTNATIAKNSQAMLFGFSLCNNTASAKFFKFYNKATLPTVGTDAVFFKVEIPANGCRDRSFPRGAFFPAGLGWAITGFEANSDATAVAAGDVSGTFDYK